jgi:outer membrane protein
MFRNAALGAAAVLVIAAAAGPLHAQSVHLPEPAAESARSGSAEPFTIDRMVELGLESSYRVRQLRLDVERRRSLLNAERARLKSRVQLELNTPEVESITETRWNSTLQRDELVAQNTRRIEMDFSVRQPVVLLGYPTNGVFSFNNRVYRYTQIDGIDADTQYYNRYFFAYDQPLFQPNRMKNSLERAQLNLEDSELAYQADIVNMIDALADDYYDLLELAYRRQVAARRVEQLSHAIDAARSRSPGRDDGALEIEQLLVEQANAIEDLNQTSSSLRLREASVKQRLQLPPALPLAISPELDVVPVAVDELEAVQLALSLAPRMRRLQIDVRESQIGLDETKGQNAFRMDVGVTYGREMQDPRLQGLWAEPRNSYTVDVRATVPILDWGERRLRIEAQHYALQRAELAVEEAEAEIETRVRSEVRNLRDFLQRAINMETNLDMARRLTDTTQARFAAREAGLVELMQALDRERLTAENFLGAYLGYQAALLQLRQLTFFDFASGLRVVDRFPICVATGDGDSTRSGCGAAQANLRP